MRNVPEKKTNSTAHKCATLTKVEELYNVIRKKSDYSLLTIRKFMGLK